MRRYQRFIDVAGPTLMVMLTLPTCAAAQVPVVASGGSTTKSLEIAALVVSHDLHSVSDLTANRFDIKIDDNAPFHPSSVRLEGPDPIALMVLLDASRDSFHDLSQIGDDLAGLTATDFFPSDTVSIYAADCVMVRSLYNAPADADKLSKSVISGLSFPNLHGGKNVSSCGKSIHLWDDVSSALLALSKLPGRRVLLVVSAGEDHGSKYDWKIVRDYAADHQIAVFGLRDRRQMDADGQFVYDNYSSLTIGAGVHQAASSATRNATALELFCANMGGLTLSATPQTRKETLDSLLHLLRHRFILDIPSSSYPAGKEHQLKVTVPMTPYFVSPAGVGPPLAP